MTVTILLSVAHFLAADNRTGMSLGMVGTLPTVGIGFAYDTAKVGMDINLRYDITNFLTLNFSPYFSSNAMIAYRLYESERLSFYGGLVSVGRYDVDDKDFLVSVGFALQARIYTKDKRQYFAGNLNIPFKLFIHESNPWPEEDDWGSPLAYVIPYLVYQLLSVGWYWNF